MRAPINPALRLDPTGRTLLLMERTLYPPITRVAEPYLKLAGVQSSRATTTATTFPAGMESAPVLTDCDFSTLAAAEGSRVQLPAGACPAAPQFSPDGHRLEFANTTDDRVELSGR